MRVYVVISTNGRIFGVYSSLELAKERVTDVRSYRDYRDECVEIFEEELDEFPVIY